MLILLAVRGEVSLRMWGRARWVLSWRKTRVEIFRPEVRVFTFRNARARGDSEGTIFFVSFFFLFVVVFCKIDHGLFTFSSSTPNASSKLGA